MNQAKSDGRETMTNGGGQPAPQPKLLDQIQETTIVLNGKELTKSAEALIHVEYQPDAECSIDYLRALVFHSSRILESGALLFGKS